MYKSENQISRLFIIEIKGLECHLCYVGIQIEVDGKKGSAFICKTPMGFAFVDAG